MDKKSWMVSALALSFCENVVKFPLFCLLVSKRCFKLSLVFSVLTEVVVRCICVQFTVGLLCEEQFVLCWWTFRKTKFLISQWKSKLIEITRAWNYNVLYIVMQMLLMEIKITLQWTVWTTWICPITLQCRSRVKYSILCRIDSEIQLEQSKYSTVDWQVLNTPLSRNYSIVTCCSFDVSILVL